MHKIRIHGRGGQGAVTTGQLIAMASFYDGLETQTFPNFGVERAGAPVQTFVKIDKEPIHDRSQIYTPDIVLIFEASLLETIDVTKGLKEGGLIIINTKKKAKELPIKGKFEIHTIDATSIAIDIFKKPIVNTPILGAFSKITKLASLSSFKKAIQEKFSGKGSHIVELNKLAIEKVYNQSK